MPMHDPSSAIEALQEYQSLLGSCAIWNDTLYLRWYTRDYMLTVFGQCSVFTALGSCHLNCTPYKNGTGSTPRMKFCCYRYCSNRLCSPHLAPCTRDMSFASANQTRFPTWDALLTPRKICMRAASTAASKKMP